MKRRETELTDEDRLLRVQRRARRLVKRFPVVATWLRPAFEQVTSSYRLVAASRISVDDQVFSALEACISANAKNLPLRLDGYSLRITGTESAFIFPFAFDVLLPESVNLLVQSIDTSKVMAKHTRTVAAAVLKSRRAMIDRDQSVWSRLLAEEKAGRVCRVRFAIDVLIEAQAPDPTNLEDYSKLSEDMQAVVGLYFLSGIIDLGMTTRVVPKPVAADHEDWIPTHCWEARFPIVQKEKQFVERSSARSVMPVSTVEPPDPSVVDPYLAEQWLDSLEFRVTQEAGPSKHQKASLPAQGPAADPDIRELRHAPNEQQQVMQSVEHIVRRKGAAEFLRAAVARWGQIYKADRDAKKAWNPDFETYRAAVLARKPNEPLRPEPSTTWNVLPSSSEPVWRVLDDSTRVAIAAARLLGHADANRHEWARPLIDLDASTKPILAVCAVGVRVADAMSYLDVLEKSTQKIAAPVSASEAGVSSERGGASNDWRVAQKELLFLCEQGERYQTYAELAVRVRATTHAVREAFKHSPTLQQWQKAGRRSKTRTSMNKNLTDASLDRTSQFVERSPLDLAEENETLDRCFHRLIEEVPEKDRAELHSLSIERQRELARVLRDHPESARSNWRCL